MIFYQIHVFLRCFIRSSKTSLFTVIPSTWRKPCNLGFLGSSGRCWAPWAAWAPWAFPMILYAHVRCILSLGMILYAPVRCILSLGMILYAPVRCIFSLWMILHAHVRCIFSLGILILYAHVRCIYSLGMILNAQLRCILSLGMILYAPVRCINWYIHLWHWLQVVNVHVHQCSFLLCHVLSVDVSGSESSAAVCQRHRHQKTLNQIWSASFYPSILKSIHR